MPVVDGVDTDDPEVLANDVPLDDALGDAEGLDDALDPFDDDPFVLGVEDRDAAIAAAPVDAVERRVETSDALAPVIESDIEFSHATQDRSRGYVADISNPDEDDVREFIDLVRHARADKPVARITSGPASACRRCDGRSCPSW